MENKKLSAFVCSLLLLLAISPNNIFAQSIKGNGKVKTEIKSVSGFDRVVIQGQVELFLTQESTESVKIEAEENLIELFQTTTSNNTLYILVPTNIKKSMAMNVTLAFKELKQIIVLDEVTLKSDHAINFDDIQIICGGTSKLDFEFKATNCTLKLLDAANAFTRGYAEHLLIEAHDDTEINAFDLQSDFCDIIGSGYSEISANAQKTLAITLSGSSNLYYMGEPTISQRNFNSTGLITKRKVGADK